MFRYVKFATVPVADQDRALRFYRDTLGLELKVDDPQGVDGWRWIEFAMPEAQTRILFGRPLAAPSADEAALLFIVDDVEAVAADLAAAGVTFKKPPTAAPWDAREMFALFEDSEGNVIRISSRKHAGA